MKKTEKVLTPLWKMYTDKLGKSIIFRQIKQKAEYEQSSKTSKDNHKRRLGTNK